MRNFFGPVDDKIVQWHVYNYQEGDLWAWLINAGHEGFLAKCAIGLAMFIAAVVLGVWMSRARRK